MRARDAEALLADAVARRPGVWADFGAGEGTFSRALARLLGKGSRVFAVDRDPDVILTLQDSAGDADAKLVSVVGDFTVSVELPEAPTSGLDGMLFANSLHFVQDPTAVLVRLLSRLRPGGRVVIVEYDGRRANRWVPYPIPRARIANVMQSAGLSHPTVTATRPSAFGGTMYVAVADRG